MSTPTPADYRESRRGGIKVAVLAAAGLIGMVIALAHNRGGFVVTFAVVTIIGVLMEGRPKARRARRRYRRG